MKKIPLDTYRKYEKENPSWKQYLSKAVDEYKFFKTRSQLGRGWDYLVSHPPIRFASTEKWPWVERIFACNGIIVEDFIQALKMILNAEDPKVRTLRLIGPPNTGKSLITQAIADFFNTCYLSNTGSASEFYFNDAINRSLIVLEEVFIVPATVDDFKSVFSGYRLGVNIKQKQTRQILEGVPCIVTGNTGLFGKGFLGGVDEEALNRRCITFHLTCPLDLRGVRLTPVDVLSYLTRYPTHCIIDIDEPEEIEEKEQ